MTTKPTIDLAELRKGKLDAETFDVIIEWIEAALPWLEDLLQLHPAELFPNMHDELRALIAQVKRGEP